MAKSKKTEIDVGVLEESVGAKDKGKDRPKDEPEPAPVYAEPEPVYSEAVEGESKPSKPEDPFTPPSKEWVLSDTASLPKVTLAILNFLKADLYERTKGRRETEYKLEKSK